MSEVAQRSMKHVAYKDEYADEGTEVSGWVGWVAFGGIMMVLSGTFQAIAGLVGIFRDTFYVATQNQLLVINNAHTWGWTNLIIGLVVVMAGISLFSGSMWSRILAVLIAMGAAVANMLAMPLYPIWSLICLSLSILVIYAVIAHGSELKDSGGHY
jgi:hypothetical protein